jgi:hypothetical protein
MAHRCERAHVPYVVRIVEVGMTLSGQSWYFLHCVQAALLIKCEACKSVRLLCALSGYLCALPVPNTFVTCPYSFTCTIPQRQAVPLPTF